MKKIMQFFIIFSLSFVLLNQLLAKEVSGTLREGEGSSFVPFQGSSFSIIRDVESGIYNGNFNISIRSGGRIIYQENGQIDDLYLVFNDPVDVGDEIRLYVNHGVFKFTMSSLETLPDVIVDAIKEQKPEQYEQMKQLHYRKPHYRKPKKPLYEAEPIEPEPIVYPSFEPEPVVYPVKEPVVSPSNYESRVIKRAVEPYDYEKEQAQKRVAKTTISQPIEPLDTLKESKQKSRLPKEFSQPIDIEPIVKPSIKRVGIKNIAQDMNIKEKFSSPRNSKRALDATVVNSEIENIAKSSKITPPKIASTGIKTLPTTQIPHEFNRVKAPNVKVSKLPVESKQIETFSKTAVPTMKKAQTGRFKTQIATEVIAPPKFSQKAPEVIVKKIEIDEKLTPPPLVVTKREKAPVIEPMPEPEIVRYKEPKVTAPVIEPEVIKPDIVKKPSVRKMDKPKDRIVITKTIVPKKEDSRVLKRHVEPEAYQREEEQIPERMSDRVVPGTSYGLATPGKIRVKAYSNNRPVSAWVEVFKAGTKQRVKTFYTGKGRTLKDVKLPAGVYVIKATYRTAGSKRKKSLGRVTLDEGGSINKTITFDDGSLEVIVHKNGKPIYAKVEVFKSGKKRRIDYAFTSRSTGIATLSLGSGTYDIVVRDHADTRRFDAVFIKGSKSKTINADF